MLSPPAILYRQANRNNKVMTGITFHHVFNGSWDMFFDQICWTEINNGTWGFNGTQRHILSSNMGVKYINNGSWSWSHDVLLKFTMGPGTQRSQNYESQYKKDPHVKWSLHYASVAIYCSVTNVDLIINDVPGKQSEYIECKTFTMNSCLTVIEFNIWTDQ